MSKVLENIKNQFIDKALFEQALTHRSWVNENKGKRTSNERLEFLGDAILEYIVSDSIFREFPLKEEGYLTALRANLVNTVNLSDVANKLEIGKILFLSRGEDEGGGRNNNSLLADTVEAMIGAIFIDQGIEAAKQFITENILSQVQEKVSLPLKDAKSRFQEEVQAQGMSTPRYSLITESGPDHAKEFLVKVEVDGKSFGEGAGKSKSEAEQKAAESALEKLGKK